MYFVFVADSRSEFLGKLQRAYTDASPASNIIPILSTANQIKIMIGNWSLCSIKDGELTITNNDGQQVKYYFVLCEN